jgi:hypothetical protein
MYILFYKSSCQSYFCALLLFEKNGDNDRFIYD